MRSFKREITHVDMWWLIHESPLREERNFWGFPKWKTEMVSKILLEAGLIEKTSNPNKFKIKGGQVITSQTLLSLIE